MVDRRAGFALLATLTVAAIGCGDGETSRDPELPAGTVAVVGEATIAKPELKGEVTALQRAHSGGRGAGAATGLRPQALAVLIQREWIEQEARKRGIAIALADARREWRSVTRQQFPTKEALRRFLGRQREADIIAQLRLQMLNQEIEQDVRRNADGNPEKAVAEFRKNMTREWTEATRCRKEFRIPECG